MLDSRRRSSKIKMKNHFAFKDYRDNRIECFTDLETNAYGRDLITLRTGKFSVSRSDNDKGRRYFINDFRQSDMEPNAVAVFGKHLIELVENHYVLPIYQRDDISIYNIGEYNHPQIKKRLIITQSEIYEEIVSD